MRDSVQPRLSKNQPPNNFMEVNVVVQRKFVRKAHVSEERDQVAYHQEETQNGVDQQRPPWNEYTLFKPLSNVWDMFLSELVSQSLIPMFKV